jgi:DNA-binding LacI/PurR family transcriptional regulator
MENLMHKVTIEDVAKRANVSKGTVSAVLNGKNTVKAATRDHVLEVIKELNYRPRTRGRNSGTRIVKVHWSSGRS